MYPSNQPLIVQAAQQESVLVAALTYASMGLSVIPLDGKQPALKSWTPYQQTAASSETIEGWGRAGLLKNLGIVCGSVSGNLVALDLDGAAGYPAFSATFPELIATYTGASGGGAGRFETGRLVPTHLVGPGLPAIDPAEAAHGVVRTLSREDFGARGVKISPDGILSR